MPYDILLQGAKIYKKEKRIVANPLNCNYIH